MSVDSYIDNLKQLCYTAYVFDFPMPFFNIGESSNLEKLSFLSQTSSIQLIEWLHIRQPTVFKNVLVNDDVEKMEGYILDCAYMHFGNLPDITMI